VSLRDVWAIARAFGDARRADRWRDRATLEAHQQRQLVFLRAEVASGSRFYSGCRGQPFECWPVISKREWMENFDRINTVGLTLAQAMRDALDDERLRRFGSRTDGLSIGLSTGTTGTRGLFVVSRAERNRWAGTMLAKLLPRPWRAQRVALLLRAGNSLYDRVGAARLRFRYFDIAQPWAPLLEGLRAFAPTILVAPPQALLKLAQTAPDARIAPARVVSCA